MTDHRLRCSASPQYQSRDLFVRKIPLPHRYNQITPFLCAPRNLYFLHFHHIIPHFYFYSNIPIHIVESDTNITTPTNHDVGDKRYFPPLIPDCYVLCTLAILKIIRNPLIFLWKMATYSCFWRVKRSKILLQASLHRLSDLLTLVSNHYIITKTWLFLVIT